MFGSAVLLARGRVKALQDLWEGDPTAWTILGVVVVLMIVWGVIKAKYFSDE
jgi:hypothetical protein